jgi:hypothetical protein
MNFFNVYFIFISALLINLSLSRRHRGEYNLHGYGNLIEALFGNYYGHNHGHRPGYNHGHGLGYNHGGYYYGHGYGNNHGHRG